MNDKEMVIFIHIPDQRLVSSSDFRAVFNQNKDFYETMAWNYV